MCMSLFPSDAAKIFAEYECHNGFENRGNVLTRQPSVKRQRQMSPSSRQLEDGFVFLQKWNNHCTLLYGSVSQGLGTTKFKNLIG